MPNQKGNRSLPNALMRKCPDMVTGFAGSPCRGSAENQSFGLSNPKMPTLRKYALAFFQKWKFLKAMWQSGTVSRPIEGRGSEVGKTSGVSVQGGNGESAIASPNRLISESFSIAVKPNHLIGGSRYPLRKPMTSSLDCSHQFWDRSNVPGGSIP